MTIIFDLDDTLFPEMDFVRSAYRVLASRYAPHLLEPLIGSKSPREAFELLENNVPSLSIDTILEIYRNHIPDISLSKDTEATLRFLRDRGVAIGIITDGRTVTQTNKIRALGLDRFINPDMVFISESTGHDKRDEYAFAEVEKRAPDGQYFYVGDNPAKDFRVANQRGWTTIMLCDRGENIHLQSIESVEPEYRPDMTISSISELIGIVNSEN